jgi:hypothetical protein
MDERAWRKRQGNRRWRPSEERRTKSEGSVNPQSNLTLCSKISQSLVNNFRLGSRSTLCRIRQCGRRCAREGTYPKRPKIATSIL